MVAAFSSGLWIGATLSFADAASGVGLIIGVLGLAISGARLLGQRLREERLRARREGLGEDASALNGDAVEQGSDGAR